MDEIEKYVQMLDSPKASVRYDACESLRVAPSLDDAAKAALERASDDPDPDVRDAAQRALIVHRPAPPPPSEIEPPHPEIEGWLLEGKKFGSRAGAYIVDLIALNAANWAAGMIGGTLIGALLAAAGLQPSLDAQALRTLDCVTGLVSMALYFTLFEGLFGASLGKLILNMRVVKEDGRPCDLGAALVRALLRFVDGLFFGLPAYLSMKPPLRQRLGDKAAKTVVVGSTDAFIQELRPWWWFLVAAALYLLLMIITLDLALLATAATGTAAPSAGLSSALVPVAWQSSAPPCTTIGQITTRLTDGMEMVCVPAGDFLMGSAGGDGQADSDEKPQHRVTLDAFWIDRTEVTNAQYKECMRADACPSSGCRDEPCLNGRTQPVVCVYREEAMVYCEWAGARLPSEAEWEKAARGTEGRIYPWGDDFDGTAVNSCDRNCQWDSKDASIDDGWSCTAPVGIYTKGTSPYGALDMAGNAWEWVSDWYSDSYYAISPPDNPQGPPGQWPVLRGGSWSSNAQDMRAASRYCMSPPYTRDPGLENIGFRCAVSPGG
jgi:formylglycine-generating enzyme required for sulfatase activity